MLHKYIQEKQVNKITKLISIYKDHIKNSVKTIKKNKTEPRNELPA